MFEGIFEPRTLLIVAVIGLILLGPKRLPSVGRKIGSWLGELRRATGGIAEELKEGLSEPGTPAPVPPPAPPAVVAPPPVASPVDAPQPIAPSPPAP